MRLEIPVLDRIFEKRVTPKELELKMRHIKLNKLCVKLSWNSFLSPNRKIVVQL